jgi:ABC-type sugar transport system permease subunit
LGQGVDRSALGLSGSILLSEQVVRFLGARTVGLAQGFLSRITVILWRCGVPILLFLAGLQGISVSLYEAAKVDAATGWDMFWKITLPMISPVVLLNIVFVIIDSFNDAGNPILDYIIDYGFEKTQFGYAAAMSWIYFLFVLVVVLLVFALLGRFISHAGIREK